MSGIHARALRRTFPLPGRETLVAVDDLDLDVHPGEVVGLLGPNGAGKTTTLRMLATLTQPTAGTATVGGFDIRKQPSRVRATLGYLSPSSGLPPRLTSREALRLMADLYGVADAPTRIAAAVERMGVGEFLDRRVDALSTGMTQRLRIACATLHDPRVLILDEPTLGLDAVATRDLLAAITAARDEGRAVLLSTHMVDDAARVCDRVAIVSRGTVQALGTPDELAERTGTAGLRDAFLALVEA